MREFGSVLLLLALVPTPSVGQEIPENASSVSGGKGWVCNEGHVERGTECVILGLATDDEVRGYLIRQSIAAYPGNCPCPYNSDRAGRRCGGRSAHSRPGGRSPLCYPRDISDQQVADARARYPAPPVQEIRHHGSASLDVEDAASLSIFQCRSVSRNQTGPPTSMSQMPKITLPSGRWIIQQTQIGKEGEYPPIRRVALVMEDEPMSTMRLGRHIGDQDVSTEGVEALAVHPEERRSGDGEGQLLRFIYVPRELAGSLESPPEAYEVEVQRNGVFLGRAVLGVGEVLGHVTDERLRAIAEALAGRVVRSFGFRSGQSDTRSFPEDTQPGGPG